MRIRRAHPSAALSLAGLSWCLLLGPVLLAPAEAGSISGPPIQRGLVYLRIQGPGAALPDHVNLAPEARITEGVMLDDPGRTSTPLLVERIHLGKDPWLVLERQLEQRSGSRASGGTLNIQRIQVLDVHPLPGQVQILAGTAGIPSCRFNERPDINLVAIRTTQPDDSRLTHFSDFLQAWRVDRRSLRLRPVPARQVSCANPAAGVP